MVPTNFFQITQNNVAKFMKGKRVVMIDNAIIYIILLVSFILGQQLLSASEVDIRPCTGLLSSLLIMTVFVNVKIAFCDMSHLLRKYVHFSMTLICLTNP